MPESRSRKKNTSRKRNTPGRPGYAGTINFNNAAVSEWFDRLQPSQYPALGLALWYLHSTPVRHRNQCHIASIVMADCARQFGETAALLGASIEIPWAKKGEGVRYGGTPVIKDGNVDGHVVTLIGDRVIDTTASQFPEIRDLQKGLPVIGSPGPAASGLLLAPETVHVALGVPAQVIAYHLTPPSTVHVVEAQTRQSNAEAISRLVNNTMVGFSLMTAERTRLGLLDIDAVPDGFRQHVEPILGHELVNAAGLLSTRPVGTGNSDV